MQQKSVEKNYLYNLLYQMLAVVIPRILTPYVSRVLSPEGVGAFSYTTAMTGYFVLFGNLGVATYGQLKIAGEREDRRRLSRTFEELVLLRLVLMTAALACFLVFTAVFSREENKSLYRVLVIQILAAMWDISWFLQGLEEFQKIVLRNTCIKLLSVVLVFTLVKKPADLYRYALIVNASTLLGNLSIWSFVPDCLERVPLRELRPFSHLKACLGYFLPSIATTIYLTLDKTMSGWFTVTSAENGDYEQAHKIEQMAVTVVTSLSVVTMPRMAFLFQNRETEKLRDRLERSMRLILLLAIPMCFGMAAVAEPFIPLYLGAEFLPSIALLRIFSLLLVVVGLNNAVGKQVLMPMGRQKQYNLAVILGACTNFVLNLLLIPRLYAVGAAIASVAAETVILLAFLHCARDMISGRWIVRNSLKYLLAALLMFAAIRLSGHVLPGTWLSLGLQVLLGIALYFAAVLALRDAFAVHGLQKALKKLRRRGV